MEKTGEVLTYLQGPTNVTRMDYAPPLFNELVFSLATEAPRDRAHPRYLDPHAHVQLNRISSHLLFLATNGLDMGAVSMMLYGWRQARGDAPLPREGHRPADEPQLHPPWRIAVDLPPGWRDDVLRLLDLIPPRLDEYDVLTGQPIWRERLQGVGTITTEEASPSARPARSCGPPATTGTCAATCRTWPTTRSTSTWWSAPTATASTATPSASTRCGSRCGSCARSSTSCPAATTGSRTRRSPRRRGRIDESMEALIHHFKIFTEGFKVPEGEVYVGVESPR